MLRRIGGVLAGLLVWVVMVTLQNFGLRYGLPGYAAVEKAMTLILPMMIGRLSISAISSLLSGYVAVLVGRKTSAAWATGVILLILFVPVHYQLLDRFPLWYHAIFLLSLPLMSIAGGALARRG